MTELIGIKIKQDGEATFYYQVDGEAEGEVGVPFGPSLSGSAEGKGVIAVTRSPEGELSSLTLQGSRALDFEPTWGADFSSLAAFVDTGLTATDDTDTRAWSATLDLTDPQARDVATDFLTAAGIARILPNPITATDPVGSGRRIVELAKEHGSISIVDYSGSAYGYGAGFGGEFGLKGGFEGGVSFEDTAVTGA